MTVAAVGGWGGGIGGAGGDVDPGDWADVGVDVGAFDRCAQRCALV
jgi:hypothetical protein